MSEDIEVRCTWRSVGLNGHRDVFGSEFLYTSQDAPVEADEYARMVQRADALLAERDAAIKRAETAENELAKTKEECDKWKAWAKYWRDRHEYDSTDAYNARINAAVRHMAQEAQP